MEYQPYSVEELLNHDFGDEDVPVEVKGITRGATIWRDEYVVGYLQSGDKFLEFKGKYFPGTSAGVLSLLHSSSESGIEATVKGAYVTLQADKFQQGFLKLEEIYLNNVGIDFLPQKSTAERIHEFFGGKEEKAAP